MCRPQPASTKPPIQLRVGAQTAETTPRTRRSTSAVPNASCTFRFNRDLLFISHHVRNGSSIPDTTLKAERGQPVAARAGFLEGNLILYQPYVRSRWVCRELSNRPRTEDSCV